MRMLVTVICSDEDFELAGDAVANTLQAILEKRAIPIAHGHFRNEVGGIVRIITDKLGDD